MKSFIYLLSIVFLVGCSENQEIIADVKELELNISNTQIVSKVQLNVQRCYPCHGMDWSKKAMSPSRDVSQMTHSEIAASLIGYKKVTYGGDMKDVMHGQIEMFSEYEINSFSKTIGKDK